MKPEYAAQVRQFIDFAQQVAKEGKTQSPVLWQSAAGWLEYLFGSEQTAKRISDKSEGMEGTQRMQDNARVIRFLVNMSNAKNSKKTDKYVAEELQWLEEKAQEDRGETTDYENHYTQMLDPTHTYVGVGTFLNSGADSCRTSFFNDNSLSENAKRTTSFHF